MKQKPRVQQMIAFKSEACPLFDAKTVLFSVKMGKYYAILNYHEITPENVKDNSITVFEFSFYLDVTKHECQAYQCLYSGF